MFRFKIEFNYDWYFKFLLLYNDYLDTYFFIQIWGKNFMSVILSNIRVL
jgi:hypothetical protein